MRLSSHSVSAKASDPAAIERSISLAFEAASVGMALTDLDGRFLRVNQGFCDLLGYPPETLTGGMKLADITHPEDESPDRPDLHAAIDAGDADSYCVEKRYLHADGGIVWGVANVSVIRDEDGDPVH